MTNATYMRQEVEEIPQAVARLLADGREALVAGGGALRERNPSYFVTIARGSSDHASSFLKYAIELTAGVPVASIGPSIASIYGKQLKLAGAAAIAVSQSGKSPDIVGMARSAKESGAHAMVANIEARNVASIRLHQRLGFETIGTLREVGTKFGRWLDLTIMQLSL